MFPGRGVTIGFGRIHTNKRTIEGTVEMNATNFTKIRAVITACTLLLAMEAWLIPNTWNVTLAAQGGNSWEATAQVWDINAAVDEVSYPFQGVKRTHRTTSVPRPLNVNVLEITLTDPGVSLFVSPGNPDPDRTACEEAIVRKTTTFVQEFGLQIGINGDFSDPDCSLSRTEGEAASVYGLGVSYRSSASGLLEIPKDQYSPHDNRPALAFTKSNQAYIGWYGEGNAFPPEVYNAVGGNKMLVENGQAVDPGTWDPIGGALDLNPRTSVGTSSDGSKLIIIIIDGREAGFSEGVTLPEMSEYLIEFGSYTGLNLDGGGSSAMVFGTLGGSEIINFPSEGTERPRPNHLGIYAISTTSVPLARIGQEEETLASALWQNYPNPFNPETWLPFTLSDGAPVIIRIYSLRGDLVRTFDLGYRSKGAHTSRAKAVYWDGRNEAGESVSSGAYFYNIQAGDFTSTRKMVVGK